MSTIAHPRVSVNGVRIANFSSPHAFIFTDGTELPACAPEVAETLKLESIEVASPHPRLPGVTDVAIAFKMTLPVEEAIASLNADSDVDIVLVPFPVMSALKECGSSLGKCRVIRTADRVTRTIYADKFCV